MIVENNDPITERFLTTTITHLRAFVFQPMVGNPIHPPCGWSLTLLIFGRYHLTQVAGEVPRDLGEFRFHVCRQGPDGDPPPVATDEAEPFGQVIDPSAGMLIAAFGMTVSLMAREHQNAGGPLLKCF